MYAVGWVEVYSPVGELIRYRLIRRLMRGPAAAGELEALAREAVRCAGFRYDWRVWPQLVRREAAALEGVYVLTDYGRLVGEALEEVERFLTRFFPPTCLEAT